MNEEIIKIVQISTVPLPDQYSVSGEVYGLGEDNKIYFWNWKEGRWQLYKKITYMIVKAINLKLKDIALCLCRQEKWTVVLDNN